MTAYVIAAETVKDDAMFDEYRKQVPATLAPFGGKFIVRGGKVTVQEGEWPSAHGGHRVPVTRPAGRLVQVSRVSKDHPAPTQELRRQLDHHRRAGVNSPSARPAG